MIDEQCLAEIFGPTQSGKSFFSCDLAFHVAAGWQWRGHRVRQGGVLCVAAEGGHAIINRMAAFQQHHDVKFDEVPIGVVFAPTNLLSNSGVDQILADAGSVPNLVLVLIDTAARVMPGGKEDTEDMGQFVAACDRIRAETRAAVAVVHHTGKDATRGSRGSSVLPAAVDTTIEVTRDSTTKIITAEITKQRDGEIGVQFAFRLDLLQLGMDEDGDPITSCVVVPDDTPPSGKRSRPKVTGTARTALDLLSRAIADAGKTVPTSNHTPANAIGVRIELWRKYFNQGSAADTTPDAKRMAFKRAVQRLQADNAIGCLIPALWSSSSEPFVSAGHTVVCEVVTGIVAGSLHDSALWLRPPRV